MARFTEFLALCCVVLFAAAADAATISIGGGVTVSCLMDGGSECMQVSGGNPATWTINEAATPTPGMQLLFNVYLPVVYYDMLLPTDTAGTPCPTSGYLLGCVSHQVQIHGQEIDFYSASNRNVRSVGNYVPCVEDPTNGCAFSFTMLGLSFADGHFDPNASMRVAFSTAPSGNGSIDTISVTAAPEPSSGAIAGAALLLLPLGRSIRSRRNRREA